MISLGFLTFYWKTIMNTDVNTSNLYLTYDDRLHLIQIILLSECQLM